jgi:hypothetical protein
VPTFVLTLVAALAFAGPAFATPRFALREGQTCKACHINPSGGAMRNHYGRNVYGPTQLPALHPRNPLGLSPLNVEVSDTFSLGADARAAYIDQSSAHPNPADIQSFMLMQADLYAAATLNNGLTLYYDQGIYGSFEATGIYEWSFGHPAFSGYVKAGHYMPAYGLRLPNHMVYTRQELGFGPRDKDTGAELGFYLGPVLVQLGVVNGAGPEFKLDDNSRKGLVGRAELLGRIGDLRVMLGVSGYSNAAGTKTGSGADLVDTRSWQTRYGAHVGAALGRFAYMGEADVRKISIAAGNVADTAEYSFRSYQELAVMLVRGLELTFNYEVRDPDIDHQTGLAHRLAAGFEFYPIASAELFFLYRHSLGSGPAERAGDGFDEVIAMAHLFY